MKIGILGAGATGCIVGYFLQKGGDDVWLVDINKSHVDAIMAKQLHVILTRRSSGVTTEELMPMKATVMPEDVGVCDMVVILTKTPNTEKAIKGALPMFGSDTFVLTLQNGIGIDDKLLEFFPRTVVGCGCLNVQSVITAPGEVRSTLTHSVGASFCGLSEQRPQKLLELEKHLNTTELRAVYAENTLKTIWQRALINLPTSFTTAIIGLPAPYIAGIPAGRDLFEQIITETVAVANAIGIDLDADSEIENFVVNVVPIIDGFPSSAVDMFMHQATEIESLNGAVSRIGHRYGIDTPANDVIANMVRVMQQTYTQQEMTKNAFLNDIKTRENSYYGKND